MTLHYTQPNYGGILDTGIVTTNSAPPTKGDGGGVLPSSSKPSLFVVVSGNFDHCILTLLSFSWEGFLRPTITDSSYCLDSRALLSAKLHKPSHQMRFLHYTLVTVSFIPYSTGNTSHMNWWGDYIQVWWWKAQTRSRWGAVLSVRGRAKHKELSN